MINLYRAHPIHSSCASFRANMAVKYMKPNNAISRDVLHRIAMDLGLMGNGYFQLAPNSEGITVAIDHVRAVNTRKMEGNQFCALVKGKIVPYAAGEIVRVEDYDPAQEHYGTPYWIAAKQAILLGEDVLIFPRAFFSNGAHTGKFIATSGMKDGDKESFEEQVKGTTSKRAGVFKTVFAHILNGDIDKMFKVFNMSENTEKIDFTRLGNASSKLITAAWRVRPELAGIMPENPGGTGDLAKIREMYHENEIVPLQHQLEVINKYLPTHLHLKFYSYKEMHEDLTQ